MSIVSSSFTEDSTVLLNASVCHATMQNYPSNRKSTQELCQLIRESRLAETIPYSSGLDQIINAKKSRTQVSREDGIMVQVRTDLNMCFKLDTSPRAGAPETAHEDIRGIRDTVFLELDQFCLFTSVFPAAVPTISTSSMMTLYHSHIKSGLRGFSRGKRAAAKSSRTVL